jgi:hypothetical protein
MTGNGKCRTPMRIISSATTAWYEQAQVRAVVVPLPIAYLEGFNLAVTDFKHIAG